MKFLKNFMVVLLLLSTILFMTSCTDKSWSVKAENETVSAGSYIYYMALAYADAYYKSDKSDSSILSQEIDGKNASQWIQDKAILSCKRLIEVEKRFDEMGLSLSEEEIQLAEAKTKSDWNTYSKTYEKFGIAKDSYHRAETMYSIKLSKLFEAIYAKNGTNPVSDEELKNYFLENYTSYKYFAKKLAKNSEYGNIDAISDEEINEAKNKFEHYANSINNGKSFDAIEAQYKVDESLENDISDYKVENLNKNTYFSDELKDCIKNLSNNKATAIREENYYYLLYKLDIDSELGNLEDEYERLNILKDMKYDEFIESLENESNNMPAVINKSVIKKYTPSIFEKQ